MIFISSNIALEKIPDVQLFSDIYDFAYGDKWNLYAYTTEKKYLDDFFKMRNKKYFYTTTRNLKKEEFAKFEKQNSKFKLGEYLYKNRKKEINIISTKLEYDESKYTWIRVVSEYTEDIFGSLPYYIIDALSEKYREAAHDVGLNALIVVADPELSSVMEVAESNFDEEDYVVTISHEGDDTPLGRKVMLPISLFGKSLNGFIYTFKKILIL